MRQPLPLVHELLESHNSVTFLSVSSPLDMMLSSFKTVRKKKKKKETGEGRERKENMLLKVNVVKKPWFLPPSSHSHPIHQHSHQPPKYKAGPTLPTTISTHQSRSLPTAGSTHLAGLPASSPAFPQKPTCDLQGEVRIYYFADQILP